MVNQLLSFGADVAGQSAELAKLVAERLACVTPPEPLEVAREAKGEAPAFPPLLAEMADRTGAEMRDYQGRIYESDCICPDCIHCDPVADECLKGRWRYPTVGGNGRKTTETLKIG